MLTHKYLFLYPPTYVCFKNWDYSDTLDLTGLDAAGSVSAVLLPIFENSFSNRKKPGGSYVQCIYLLVNFSVHIKWCRTANPHPVGKTAPFLVFPSFQPFPTRRFLVTHLIHSRFILPVFSLHTCIFSDPFFLIWMVACSLVKDKGIMLSCSFINYFPRLKTVQFFKILIFYLFLMIWCIGLRIVSNHSKSVGERTIFWQSHCLKGFSVAGIPWVKLSGWSVAYSTRDPQGAFTRQPSTSATSRSTCTWWSET